MLRMEKERNQTNVAGERSSQSNEVAAILSLAI